MAVSKIEKAMILKAYFEKSISKVDMKLLLSGGLSISPIEWVYSNEVEKREQNQKRELISKVFGHSFPKIEWI